MSDIAASLHRLSTHLAKIEIPRDSAAQMRLAAELAPALTEIRRHAAGLGHAERAELGHRIAGSAKGKQARIAHALAALATHPAYLVIPPYLLLIYLMLWVLDIAVVEQYVNDGVTYDLPNPDPSFWYQRTDTAGTHVFNQNDIYLTETIPQADQTAYWNCEVYNATFPRTDPSCVIANLFPVDPPNDPNFDYDLFLNIPFAPQNGLQFSANVQVGNLVGGSRGWGFWNTSVLPPVMQVAWFIQFNGQASGGVQPLYPNGFYAITQNGVPGLDTGPDVFKLPDLDEDAHDYQITISGDSVQYWIDGVLMHTAAAPSVPTAPMAIHIWVDNAVFGYSATSGIVHILQDTTGPRSNIVSSMQVSSPPPAG
jgi:hypothetical protein